MTVTVPSFDGVRILVTGDVMLDRYWFGATGRISPEAPVPVVRVDKIEERPGGAANVAVNLTSLGAKTRLQGITGRDEAAESLSRLLQRQGIEDVFVAVDDMPTITKLRVLSRNQQLIRLDFENPPKATATQALLDNFSAAAKDVDAVILSDYGKGALTRADELITMCRQTNVKVFVDPKGTDFERYRGATALTPNLAEFETVVGPCPDEEILVAKAFELRKQLELDYLLITRSERGMTVFGKSGNFLHLPAEAREVFDVTGAGDTVIAMFGVALAAGLAAEDAAALANLAAGLVVRKIGVATVTPSELRLALHQRGKGGRGLVTATELVEFVRESQQRGERVVMTNGCFDILHAGHIAYLEEAKNLGDRLIVAVNDDASVTRLKGEDRPVNTLGDRMAVLAGLAAVDWVVPFSDDTPEKLIGDVLPDLLVKGGDYKPEDIAGSDSVTRNGGEVRVLSYRDGRSTSAIIDAIKRH